MGTSDDEIARLEREGIQKLGISDWAGARALFERALSSEMPPRRKFSLLQQVAQTYALEGNHDAAAKVASRAIEVVKADTGGECEDLKNEFRRLESSFEQFEQSEHAGRLPLSNFWYGVVFLGGLYWGISFASGMRFVNGAPMTALPTFGLALLFCWGIACISARGVNRRSILGAITLSVDFLISFSIGYGLSSSGLVRFGYYTR